MSKFSGISRDALERARRSRDPRHASKYFTGTVLRSSRGVVSIACLLFLASLAGVEADAQPSQQPRYAPQAEQTAGGSTQVMRPVQVRLAAQNELFKRQWDDDMKASPETATAYGDYRYNGLLSDYSLAAHARQSAADRASRARLAAISTDGFPEQDHLSHDLLLHLLDQRIADYSLKVYEMPVSQMQGIHSDLADLPNAVPLDTLKHYDDYVARLHQIPRAFERTMEVLRQGEKDGLVPPRVLLHQIPAQCEDIIAADPFLQPTGKIPDSISSADRQRLTREITRAATSEVLPAYRHFADFVVEEYAPHGGATIGLISLPNGAQLYRNTIREQTTTDMSPADIHALGLQEVTRINGLLEDLARKAGYGDLRSFRTALNNDPKYIPKSADQIVDDFRRYVSQMQSSLPELFAVLPNAPLTVEAMPPSQPGIMRDVNNLSEASWF
jgi:uncharacterized protein (DUF885 family)